jgi:hypothetical protein
MADQDDEEQFRAACVSVLEAVAATLADLVVSVRSAAEQIRPGPTNEHQCVMPRGADLLTIHRCSCGKSYRLYPPSAAGHPSAELGLAQWQPI